MRDHRRHERGRERFEDLSRSEQIEHDPSIIDRAREHVRNLSLPGTPSVDHGRTLQAAGLPAWCGSRKVVDVDITYGRPGHGEMRSEDHVGHFEVQCNIGDIDVDWDVEPEREFSLGKHVSVCPECGTHRALYQYSAYHHIAGSESVNCLGCNKLLYSKEWG